MSAASGSSAESGRRSADDSRPEHVPADYYSLSVGDAVLWGRDRSEALAALLFEEARGTIERLLDYRLSRIVHVVVYASNEEACRSLDRRVAPTQLLAPLHTPALALVALQAPAVDPLNGDPERMRRHLCHELAHVFSAERTGSVKRLGDEDRGMRLSSWVDEGFAENVAAAAAARPDIIEAALQRSSVAEMSDERLASAFGDLSSTDRAAAFATATARVWRAAQARGLKFVFENLSRPRSWLS
jgi:hypothetical protein